MYGQGQYTDVLEENDTFVLDQTLEIYELSRSLGLQESELPCLVLTLLQPQHIGVFTQVTIPFEHLNGTTLYSYVKRLAEDFQDIFKDIDGNRQKIEATRHEAADIQRYLSAAVSLIG